ncbi:CRISPR-associated helicase Cas3 [[Clostridium] ultunense Esp]|nr:CRISPR-associated helicase Cas3 [[Clostridium] ultunense Esp]
MVIPFHQCIARPKEGDRNYPLPSHLETVARGLKVEDTLSGRISFLAGLLHDIGKARTEWQLYLLEKMRGERKKKVPHSKYGAVLFAFYASRLLEMKKREGEGREAEKLLMLRWVRDIMDHHGELKDIEKDAPWLGGVVRAEEFGSMDLSGIHDWLTSFYPEFGSFSLTVTAILQWMSQSRRSWEQGYRSLKRLEIKRAEAAKYCLRHQTAAFIQADRFDAAQVEERKLTGEMIQKGLKNLDDYLERLNHSGAGISSLRRELQERALSTYEKQVGSSVFLLDLPTGMGKTITSLKIALTEAGRKGRERLVYVAPYLSILSQTAGDIRKATGLGVQEHHSLMWNRFPTSEKNKEEQGRDDPQEEEMDEKAVLLLEAWQSPIIATTFHQLFRGFFPRRAQQTMRLSGLKNTVLIIDEPQVIGDQVWLPFLKMLEEIGETMDCTILIVTATMPPVKILSSPPTSLIAAPVSYPDRYVVRMKENPMSADQLVFEVEQELTSSQQVGIILNTIRDSADVYRKMDERLGDGGMREKVALIHLNGAMTPLHKAVQIGRVKERVGRGRGERPTPTVVISTQMIEAGVDISFRTLYRALSIYPSLVQAAGRVNRHREAEEGKMVIFSYVREDGTDTRRFVYRDSILREITDQLLLSEVELSEREFVQKVEDYYEQLYARQKLEAALDQMIEAAKGRWSEISGILPFEEERMRIPVFVPWGQDFIHADPSKMSEELRRLQDQIRWGLQRYGISDPEELYEHYTDFDRFGRLEGIEQKRFMGLLQQFIVPVHAKTALSIVANWDDPHEIKRISSLKHYSDENGLALHIGHEEGGELW